MTRQRVCWGMRQTDSLKAGLKVPYDLLAVGLIGFMTTASVLVGAYVGLYFTLPERLLSTILAFAAGSLIAALAIELSFEGAVALEHQGFSIRVSWLYMAGGFLLGAILYYVASLFLDSHGAALRFPHKLLEYTKLSSPKPLDEKIGMLAKCSLLKHINSSELQSILAHVKTRDVAADTIVFNAGDSGEALYIVVDGDVIVLGSNGQTLAMLGAGDVFGEMALIDGSTRKATVKTAGPTTLLEIDKQGFAMLIDTDPALKSQIHQLAQKRSLANINEHDGDSSLWARMYRNSLGHLGMQQDHGEQHKIAQGKGVGLAIIFGNLLDTIPGCLVIGAKFVGFESMSATLMVGMFLGGIPESAASATLLRRAGYSASRIYLMWSTVIIAGIISAILGKMFISDTESVFAIVMQAIAAGAILAMVSHAMIPEAFHKGGSASVMPIVFGFLFALYLSLEEAKVKPAQQTDQMPHLLGYGTRQVLYSPPKPELNRSRQHLPG